LKVPLNVSPEVAAMATPLVFGDILLSEATSLSRVTLNRSPNTSGFYLNSDTLVMQKASRGQRDVVVHISGHAFGSIEFPKREEAVAKGRLLLKQGLRTELLPGRIRRVCP